MRGFPYRLLATGTLFTTLLLLAAGNAAPLRQRVNQAPTATLLKVGPFSPADIPVTVYEPPPGGPDPLKSTAPKTEVIPAGAEITVHGLLERNGHDTLARGMLCAYLLDADDGCKAEIPAGSKPLYCYKDVVFTQSTTPPSDGVTFEVPRDAGGKYLKIVAIGDYYDGTWFRKIKTKKALCYLIR
jgi:hypothetical protein